MSMTTPPSITRLAAGIVASLLALTVLVASPATADEVASPQQEALALDIAPEMTSTGTGFRGALNVPSSFTSGTVCLGVYEATILGALGDYVTRVCGAPGSAFEISSLTSWQDYAIQLVDANLADSASTWDTYTGRQVWYGNRPTYNQSTVVYVPGSFIGTLFLYWFEDVNNDNPFYSDISWMGAFDVSTGYADGTYRPTGNVTRQAMAAFLYRFAGEPTFTAPAVSPFDDVPTSHPFYHQITWMAHVEISTGYPDDTFRPAANVSRMAMSAFLYRFLQSPVFEAPATSPFDDVSTDHPFYSEIAWMADSGISEGYNGGTEYRPSAQVSRQAMAAFLFRVYNNFS